MAIRAETQVDLARVDDGFSPTATVTKTGDTATITITDKNQTTTASISDGDEGVSITSVKPQYYLHTSSTATQQEIESWTWSDTPQAFVSGMYYWTRDYIDYSDGTHDTSTAVYNAGLTQANQEALEANTKADNVAQYFWFNSTDSGAGEGAGAHITEIPRDDFVDDPANGGFNTLVDSAGMKVRNGLNVLAQYGENITLLNDGNVAFNVTQGARTENVIKFESVSVGIDNGNSYTFSGDSSATLVSSGRFTVVWKNKATVSFTIGTSTTGTFDGVVYVYNGANNVTVTNNTGNTIMLDSIWYDVVANVALMEMYGDLLIKTYSSDNVLASLITGGVENGLFNIKKALGSLIRVWSAPTFSTQGLSPVSSRCEIKSGGFIDIGYYRYVQLEIEIKATLSANNAWGILDGIGTTNQSHPHVAFSSAVINKYGGSVSTYLNDNGRLVVLTDDAVLSSGDILLVTGIGYIDVLSATKNQVL